MKKKFIVLLPSESPNTVGWIKIISKKFDTYAFYREKKNNKFRKENFEFSKNYKSYYISNFFSYLSIIKINPYGILIGGWPKGFFEFFFICIIKIILNVKIFHESEQSFSFEKNKFLKKFILKIYLNFFCEGMFCIGNLWYLYCKKFLDIKCHEIYYMTDNIFTPKLEEHSINKFEGKLKLVSVSRLIKEKNIISLIKLVNIINNKKKEIHIELDIIGDGCMKEELVQLSKKSNLNVNFLGYLNRNAIKEKFDCSDLFILLSEFEGFGMAPIEASLRGLPLVISKNIPSVYSLYGKKEWIHFFDIKNLEDESNINNLVDFMKNIKYLKKVNIQKEALSLAANYQNLSNIFYKALCSK